ncbi:CpaF family protein [Jeongeupia wiesaeckerbachi]|uniref:CpaF family protein n=1 Tax=Jeongeupia wiesaeckerbachi TaxID=3051218 RepID=UPI003D803688
MSALHEVSNSAYAELRRLIADEIKAESALAMSLAEIDGAVGQIIAGRVRQHRIYLNQSEQRQLTREIVDDMVRLGPLQVLMDDPEVSDIMVNGPQRVFVEKRGRLQPSGQRFRDGEHLMNLAQRIAGGVGRRIDEASPMVDARLPDGSRVNIVAPPLALDGVCMSIRKFARHAISLDGLVSRASLTQQMADVLKLAARARFNILISGGTGSGKTTLLNALSQHIDANERIVTIEDAAELRLQQPHIVRLETRPPSLEGRGEITQRDLLKNALRMRPDRILLGEVRGAEAFDMLQAMNTGHDGSISTLHANSPADALLRLENMLNMGVVNMPSALIHRQLASAIDLLVQVERAADGQRRVTRISAIVEADGDVRCVDVFAWRDSGEARTAHAVDFDDKLASAGLIDAWREVLGERA